MLSIKRFAFQAIENDPSRYAVDNGDLNLINDYFISQGWQTLTREQHKAIAGVIRKRNEFLLSHEAFDLRTKQTAYENTGQLRIYDFIDDEANQQLPKITKYFTADPLRLKQSVSRIKKSVRNVDSEHISVAKIMLPLLQANPKLKQRRQKKAPCTKAINNISDEVLETKSSNKCSGESALT